MMLIMGLIVGALVLTALEVFVPGGFSECVLRCAFWSPAI